MAYLILTAFMTIGALRTTKVLFFIFLAIDFLFVGLALSAFRGCSSKRRICSPRSASLLFRFSASTARAPIS